MRSIFITGGSAGIGLAAARLFRDKGWRVGIGDIAPDPGEPGLVYFPLDVRDRVAWGRVFDEFASAGLDVLVNNAGVVRYGPFDKIAAEDADLIIDVNVKGVMNGVRAALPYLRKGKNPVIVNIASAGAIYGGKKLAPYCASKFAVRGLTEALDGELASEGIRLSCVMPWFTESAMIHQAGTGQNASIADDIATSGLHGPEVPAVEIWRAVHGDKLHRPVGRQARFAYHMVRLFPKLVRRGSQGR